MTNNVPKNALLSQKSKNIWEGNSSKEPIQYSTDTSKSTTITKKSTCMEIEMQVKKFAIKLEAEDKEKEWEVSGITFTALNQSSSGNMDWSGPRIPTALAWEEAATLAGTALNGIAKDKVDTEIEAKDIGEQSWIPLTRQSGTVEVYDIHDKIYAPYKQYFVMIY